MAARGPQNGRRGVERGLSLGFSQQLLLNMFFYWSTSSMRKGRNGETKQNEKQNKKPQKNCGNSGH